MNKYIIIIVFLNLFWSSVYAEQAQLEKLKTYDKAYSCKKHQFSLVEKKVGYEHVSYQLYIDGKTLVSELSDGSWYVEKINCTNSGFEIIASHIQYGDPTKTSFRLSIQTNKDYKIKEVSLEAPYISKLNADVGSSGKYVLILATYTKLDKNRAFKKRRTLLKKGHTNVEVLNTNHFPNLKNDLYVVGIKSLSKKNAIKIKRKFKKLFPDAYVKSGE